MPQDVDQQIQTALRLHQAGQAEDAYKEYGRILKRAPKRADVMNLAGIAALQLGDANAAVKYLDGAAKAFPDDPEIAYNYGIALKQRNNLTKAATQFERAITLHPDHADAWNNLGSTRMDLGDTENALAAFEQALALEPKNPQFLENAGGAQEALNNPSAARDLYDRTLSAGGDRARLLTCIGTTYMDDEEGDDDEALKYFAAALDIQPNETTALALTGYILERHHEIEAAETAIRRGLNVAAGDPLLNSVMARIEIRRKEWEPASQRLFKAMEDCKEPGLEVKIRSELSNVLDRLGRYDDAIGQIKKASRIQLGLIRPDLEVYRDRLSAYRQIDLASIPAATPSDDEPEIIFVVGFPRSGTTLVGAMLNGHPRTCTLDERPMIDAIEMRIEDFGNGSFAAGLSQLTPDRIEELRGAYLDCARRFGWDGTTVLVDKHPLNMTKLTLLGRLFPYATAVNVLRHPLDTCLSCYMQDFRPNVAMVHFLTLETTVSLYHEVLTDWLARRGTHPLKVVDVIYEELVEAGIEGLRPVIRASSLTWDEDILSYNEQSKKSDIRTPSYRQVTEGVYTRARERWRNYEKHLRQAHEALADIGESLGYDMSVD